VGAGPIGVTLAAFIVTYLFIFGAGTFYMLHLIAKGPETEDATYGDHGLKTPVVLGASSASKGGGYV
jgi:cytochrome d ubiquinol oxidase subunit I